MSSTCRSKGAGTPAEPLIRLIDRVLGPDHLVGIMTPKMSAADMVLARKTDVMASGLRNIWPWGERFTLPREDIEHTYEACYPMPEQAGIVAQMIERRRERAVLDSLNELVVHPRNIREERKAIVTVSEGWLLFRPDPTLTNCGRIRHRDNRTHTGTGSHLGRPGRKNHEPEHAKLHRRDEERMRLRPADLSMLDNERYFRDIIDEAEHGKRLVLYRRSARPPGLRHADRAWPAGDRLRSMPATCGTGSNLRTLADATDGIAVMNNNDLDAGLKRISDDLSSYYLLGYYSSNGKLDGRFHSIKVRVKRPGVDVRARKGYRSATAAEITAAKAAAPPPVPDWLANVTSAISSLARIRPDSRLSLNAVPVPAAGSRAVSTVWIAGELLAVSGTDPWGMGERSIST